MDEKSVRVPVNIEDQMRESYMDYAMSVIIGHALPDARDGLKPVHRRILYAMLNEGLTHTHRYSKCAGVVGEVLKRYHPHGDSAVYDALVRLAQEWNVRYPLIDGQGNFGSIDGDSPAAYRYTECRLTELAEELLADIDKETVDFVPNFDDSTQEPVVLPSKVPNLLINGSAGIAVGMATNIPPHNLGEVCDALVALLEHPERTVDELMRYIPGPDFPTAGFICGQGPIREAYREGRGILTVRARATVETDEKSGRSAIIVTEIPYQVNKRRLIERIAELVNERKLNGIASDGLRDESDRDGMRIVIELKRDAVAEVLLNQLYKHTPLEESFGVNMLTIVEEYAETEKAIARYRAILADEREVAKIIADELRALREKYGDERRTRIVDEAAAISVEDLIVEEDMVVTISHEGYIKRNAMALYRAQRRGGRGRIGASTREEDFVEHLFIASTHSYLLFFTTSGKVFWLKVHDIPQAGRAARGRSITNLLSLAAEEKLSAFLPVREFQQGRYVMFATRRGLVKKTDLMQYASPRPSGIIAIALEDGDEVIGVRLTDGSQQVILSTRDGQAIRFKEDEARPMGRDTYGVRGMRLDQGDEVVAVDLVESGATLLAVSENGYGKRTEMEEYRLTRRGGKGIITMKTTEKTGRVIGVRMVTNEDQIMLVTSGGKVIRLRANDIRVIGRNTQGVRLIGLEEGEQVASVARLADRADEGEVNDEPVPPVDPDPTAGA